jgi:hypothetical protein
MEISCLESNCPLFEWLYWLQMDPFSPPALTLILALEIYITFLVGFGLAARTRLFRLINAQIERCAPLFPQLFTLSPTEINYI